MRSEKIDLDWPVTVDGAEYKTLNMRSPKVRDMLVSTKAGATDAEREVCLFGNLCELPRNVIEELEMADYGKMQEAYTGFLSSRSQRQEKPA